MGFYQSYMGTKRAIAGAIACEVSLLKSGPMLDLFAGMSAVGASVGPTRQVWCNDVQHYAYEVAQSLFVDRNGKKPSAIVPAVLERAASQREFLNKRLSDIVEFEAAALASGNTADLVKLVRTVSESRIAGDLAALGRSARAGDDRSLYSAMTVAYAGGYFGIAQSIAVDAIRFGIESLFKEELIGSVERRRMVIAMGRALATIANSTGHFAQYLAPKDATAKRFVRTRKRSFTEEWRTVCSNIRPHGLARWRANNRAFRSDAVELLSMISTRRVKPSVVYADPPYTADHYSRYYHVLETLILYDFPEVVGKGLYRPDRHVSEFSVKSKVRSSFERLVNAVAQLDADVVISYPDRGLFEGAREIIPEILLNNYRYVSVPLKIDHVHSTMGASKGVQKAPVSEYVFVGRSTK